MFKNRLHLIEIEDQNWLPRHLRRYLTDLLEYQIRHYRIYDNVVPVLLRALSKAPHESIVDLCSGSAGPVRRLVEIAQSDSEIALPKFLLSDKFPNFEAFEHIKNTYGEQIIDYCHSSVDATDVPSTLRGFRTMFTAFHHFQKPTASDILLDATRKGNGIAIFEFTRRTFLNVFKATLFSAPLVLLDTLSIRPFEWRRILFTYLIPIVPLIYTWDAIASHLRTYSLEELAVMTGAKALEGHDWEWGHVRSGAFGFTLTYLIGTPKSGQKKL